MTKNALSGTLLNEGVTISMSEICVACSCRSEWVVELVNEGILQPLTDEPEELFFSGDSLTVAQAAQRLQRDLGVNLEGVALVLELLDEVKALRAQLRRP
jgi:chaperone modulatory protein CbpM